MLKLTNSFSRYLNFTCENKFCNKAHVKSFTQLTNVKQTCRSSFFLSVFCSTKPFINTGQPLRSYAYKKRFGSKKFTNSSNEAKKIKEMSDSLQPTLSHVSFGGQFDISSSDDSSSSSEWTKPKDYLKEDSTDHEVLKTTPSDSGFTTTTLIREQRPIPSDFRIWEHVLDKKEPYEGNTFKFKVLSYNVLAQYLLECHPYLYTECHPFNLKWRIRASRLYDEIVKLAPDILCLQEVQASHINSFYAKFEEIGYFGLFKQKTGQRHDGCAIYFKQSLFDMQDHVTVEYYQPELPILNRDNIGIMVKLMPKNYLGPPVVVATTHLLYNPRRTDVRLAQLQVLLAEIDRFAYYNDGKESGYLPIILTGDFNSTPDSAVIKLLDNGHVSANLFRDSSDWKRIGVTDNCQHLSVLLNRQQGLTTEFIKTKIYNSDYRESMPSFDLERQCSPTTEQHSDKFNSGSLSHSLNFSSMYTKYKPDGCPEATTYQDCWVTVDYIYFSYCSTLRLVERLRLPTVEECDVLGKLPNDAYGSDHLALAGVFELKSGKSALQCTLNSTDPGETYKQTIQEESLKCETDKQTTQEESSKNLSNHAYFNSIISL